MGVMQREQTGAWAEWPTPSPTSQRNINVRFYAATDSDSTMRLDIGPENEHLLEELYGLLGPANRLREPMRPADFEGYIRAIYQARLNALVPYTLQLARYAVLTADNREVKRALGIEQRNLLRSLRLMPFALLPGVAERPMPQTTGQRVRWMAGYLWTRLLLLFPIRLA